MTTSTPIPFQANQTKGRPKKKVLALILVVVLLAASILAGMTSSLKGGPTSSGGQTETWKGVIMPLSTLNQSGTSYVLTGNPVGETGAALRTIQLTSSIAFEDITGGEFAITSSSGKYSLSSVISAPVTQLDSDEVASAISEPYKNIEAEIISTSVVYGGYTFGIGSDGTNDYIWIGVKKSLPTLFSRVQITGTTLDEATLKEITNDFSSSAFGKLNLSQVEEVAKYFGFSYHGNQANIIAVTDLEYLDTYNISCDVIDKIVPSDINRLADNFSIPGTNWMKRIVGNIGEGCAIATESDTRLTDNKLWFALYPLNQGMSFNGVCQVTVAKTDLSSVLARVTNLSASSFEFNIPGFELNVGVIISTSSSSYVSYDVVDLWNLDPRSTNTIVGSCDVKGYGIIIDAQSIITGLSKGFSTSENTLQAINTLTTFRNPAIVILEDENFPDVVKFEKPIWEYGTVVIIPDYHPGASNVRYLEVRGSVYNMATYLGLSQFDIPFIIADSYQDVSEGIQKTTLTDICNGDIELGTIGGYSGAYVDFTATTVGVGVKSIAVTALAPYPAAKMAVESFPLDLGIYWCEEQGRDGTLYNLPIIYIASEEANFYGPSATLGLPTLNVRGLYIQFESNSPFEAAPTGIIQAARNALMSSGAIPQGCILAFSMESVLGRPYYGLTTDGTSVTLSWSATNDANFDHYNVYRSTNSSFTPGPTTLFKPTTDTSMTVTGLTRATSYYFIVRIQEKDGSYVDTNMVCTRTYTSYDSASGINGALVLYNGSAWTESCPYGDSDWFGVELKAGDIINVNTIGSGGLGDIDLFLHSPGKPYPTIASSCNFLSNTESISYTVSTTGIYFIEVRAGVGASWYTVWVDIER